jgi:hypothetical protein
MGRIGKLGDKMNGIAKKLTVVNLGAKEVPEKTIRPYYKKTHPELASLAELVADFPADVRPLIEDLGSNSELPEQRPLGKSDIDSATLGNIEHKEKSTKYSLLLVSSLIAMALIICVYLVAVFAVACVTVFSANNFVLSLDGNDMWSTTSYGLYAVFSFLLVVGMVKSILMKHVKKAEHVVTKEEEPIFFYYLESMCDNLNVPMPDSVYLTCDVDVSCHYRRFFSKKIELHVGMPLVSGFSTKELAGVLAHELCRFSRYNSPLLVERVRSMYLWMGKVSCHQDHLDKYIYNLNRKLRKSPFKLAFMLVELFFKIPRWGLHGLMWLTHLCCQFAIYKIDYDCDFYEMQFAGSKKFTEIAYNMEIMSQTCNNTHNGFEFAKKNEKLYEDLPGHIAATSIMRNADRQQIVDKFTNKKERITEIHPAFKKRVAKAAEYHNPGIFDLEKPATGLFMHLKQHKRKVSLAQYELYFGSEAIKSSSLKTTESELREMNELSRDWNHLERFFHGIVSFERIPVVDRKHPLVAKNWIQALRDLKETHSKIKSESHHVRSSQSEYEHEINFKHSLDCARDFFLHNKESHSTIDVLGRKITKKNVEKLLEVSKKRLERSDLELSHFHDLCSARICYAVQLLNRKEFRAKIEKGELYRKNLSHILHYLRIFDHIKSSLLGLKNNFIDARTLMDSNEDNFELENGLSASRSLLHKSLVNIELKLLEVPHPFSDEMNESIMEYIGFEVPEAQDFGELLFVAEETYERSTSIYFKVLTKLIHIVEEVEDRAGLKAAEVSEDCINLARTCG